MGNIKKKYPPELKARIAIELLKEQKTIKEICNEHSIHSTQAMKWKSKAKEIIRNGMGETQSVDLQVSALTHENDELYKKLGKLQMENDYLKKNLSLIN